MSRTDDAPRRGAPRIGRRFSAGTQKTKKGSPSRRAEVKRRKVLFSLTSSLLFLFSLGFVHFCIAFVASNISDKIRFCLYLSMFIRYICSNNVFINYTIPTKE